MNLNEELKKYLDESELELEEVDLGEKTIDDIKADLVLFSDYYLRFFNNFYKVFKDCTDKQVVEFINKNKKHFLEVLKLNNAHKQKIENNIYCNSIQVKKELIQYIENNYFDISEFVDVYMGVIE